jgi:hypothetical protein
LISNGAFDMVYTIDENEYNGITVTDPDGFLSQEQSSLTETHGTLTLAAGSGVTITGGANNSAAVTFKGTLSQLNTALDGLFFAPTAGFTGTGASGASITIVTNDLSSVSPGPLTATSTVNIDVVNPPSLIISELFLNPPGAPDHPNQYIEIRSVDTATGNTLPNYTIPSGTYLLSIGGSPLSVQIGQTLTNYPTGTVIDTFDLSGFTTGSNGYLVILENGNTYNNYPDFGGQHLVDPHSTVLDNGINPDGSIAIGTGGGYGNNSATFGAPGSSIVGHSSLFRPNNIDIYKPSATFMLINSPGAVNPGDSLDSPLNVAPTGSLHGPEFDSWTVLDAVGGTLSTQTQQGDMSYGFINYIDNTLAGSTNLGTPNSTSIHASFTADYFGRANNNTGWVASDWVASSGINGLVPTYALGGKNNTIPASAANRPLNNIGGPNFDSSQPPVVTTAHATINYPIGSGPVVIDPSVVVTDADSFFLGSAQVAITSGFNAPTDSLAFAGTPFISGSYNAATGVLTLTGDDTIASWNAALQSVTFSYSGSVVGNPPTRTITFAANDGLVLSSTVNSVDFINIQGPVANPPVIAGTSSTPVTWTETLPPNSAPIVVVAPGLSITDVSTSQLTSATVAISANFISGQDALGWNDATATTNHITVTASAQNRTLTLTPTTPDTSESLAAFQAVLQTVTYTNSSKNPNTAPRTVTFTVIDSNSITSSIAASSQQVISVVAVNNPPTVTASPGANNYFAGSAAILADGAMTETDPDSASLTGATIAITGGFASGDTLSFVNQVGVTGSYNSASGVLTLSGSAIPLDYQVALRAVTFSAGPGTQSGTRTISFTVNDGLANGNTATKQITVQSALVPGDFNFNGHLDADDIPALLSAFTNLSGFQSTHQLYGANLLTLADLNGDGFVRNSDIQRLLDMVAALGGGSGSSTSGVAGSAQTTNSSAAPSVANSTPLSTASTSPLVLPKNVQRQSSIPMGPFVTVQTRSKSATSALVASAVWVASAASTESNS